MRNRIRMMIAAVLTAAVMLSGNAWAQEGQTEEPITMPAALPLYMLDRYEPGMTVLFGCYEQDADAKNGPEDIEWVILDIIDGQGLLLSRYTLERVVYNTDMSRASYWDRSNLSRWLNDEFLNGSFAWYELSAIVPMPKEAAAEQEIDGETVSDYTDALASILSSSQLEKYFPDLSDRICYPTPYAVTKGGKAFNGASAWFIRVPSESSIFGSYIASEGQTFMASEAQRSILVRPCIWVRLY